MDKKYDFHLEDKKVFEVYTKSHVYRLTKEYFPEIHEHKPQGEGDRYYYDVVCIDGSVTRLFEFSKVIYVPRETI